MHEMHFTHSVIVAGILAAFVAACAGDGTPEAPATPPPPSVTVRPPNPTQTPPLPAPTPTAPRVQPDLPTGFPLDPGARADLATGQAGSRAIDTGAGPSIREVTALQAAGDPLTANASGWNCHVHVEYEGAPAVDWYVAPGTPVYATIDGVAVLIVNTVANAFDYYGVDREPYLGDPDRFRAPVVPFPGPGGGMGFYVAVIGSDYRTDYGHLAMAPTLATVPDNAFAAPYSRAFDYASTFAAPQPSDSGVQVASWRVRKGGVIGYTGDAGYSEAPHLHYTITRRATGERLCPTGEEGFSDGGWLTR